MTKPNGSNHYPAPEASSEETSKLDIRLYVHIVRRRLWVLLAVVGAALGIAIFLTSRMPNKYRAEATVVVDLKAAQILGHNVQGFDSETSGWWQGTTFLKTQEEVLKSERIARLAAAKMKPQLLAKLLDKSKTAAIGEGDLIEAGHRILGMRTVKPGSTSDASSKGQSLPTFPSCNPRGSSSLSTFIPPVCSACPFPTNCSRSPTR